MHGKGFAAVVLILAGVSMAAAQSEPPKARDATPAANSTKQAAAPAPQPTTIYQVFGAPNDSPPPRGAQQGKLQQFLDKATDPIALLTLALVLLTGVQVGIYLKQTRILDRANETARVVERAYVKTSFGLPGISFSSDSSLEGANNDAPRPSINLTVIIENFGNTPGVTTFRLVQVDVYDKGKSLPVDPVYRHEEGTIVRASLVKGESFNIMEARPLKSVDELAGVRNGSKQLYVTGYVDYIDKFQQRHRAGFARVYDPTLDKNTLPIYRQPDPPFAHLSLANLNASFDIGKYANRNNLPYVTQPDYNYDRERERSDGHDWDELSRWARLLGRFHVRSSSPRG